MQRAQDSLVTNRVQTNSELTTQHINIHENVIETNAGGARPYKQTLLPRHQGVLPLPPANHRIVTFLARAEHCLHDAEVPLQPEANQLPLCYQDP